LAIFFYAAYLATIPIPIYEIVVILGVCTPLVFFLFAYRRRYFRDTGKADEDSWKAFLWWVTGTRSSLRSVLWTWHFAHGLVWFALVATTGIAGIR